MLLKYKVLAQNHCKDFNSIKLCFEFVLKITNYFNYNFYNDLIALLSAP
jgi:hypothetical protein